MSELPTNELLENNKEPDYFEFPEVEGYLVQRMLGQGAHGRVFNAIDISVGALVAIKVLNPISSQRQDLRERFDREVKAYYAVRDSRLVQPRSHGLISQGVYRGCPFVVLEYMDGGSFKNWLMDHPANNVSTLRVAVQILAQVCEGLSHLHEKNIVHRDLKPANILLAGVVANSDGTPYPKQVRITDFGLAAFLNESRDLSKTGMGVGTPAYMSPEQFVDAKNITPASDQYAIGVMLYQLLCSRRPWQSSAEESEAPGILEARAVRKIPPPPPSSSVSRIDKQLKKVCLRCLEPNPEDRYRDTEELAEDLRKWIRGEPIVEPGSPIKWFYHRRVAQPIKRNPGLFLLAILCSLVAITSGYIGWSKYAYQWPYEQYFESIVERNGAFVGSAQAIKRAAQSRYAAFKITRAGRLGPTLSVERQYYNRFLSLSLVDLIEQQSWTRLEYSYKQDKSIDFVDAFDKNGLLLWRKVFIASDQAKLLVTTPEGLQLDQADSTEVSIFKYDWDENGYLARVRYFDRHGAPTIGLNGGYGLRYLVSKSGEITEVSILGPDGKYPMTSKLGFATVRHSESWRQATVSMWDHKGARATVDGYSYFQVSFDSYRRIKSARAFHADHSEADLRVPDDFGFEFPIHEISFRYALDGHIERFVMRSSKLKDSIQVKTTWGDDGKLKSTRFLSEAASPICLIGGVHGVNIEDTPAMVRETFVGLSGEPVSGPEGYAIHERYLKSEYQEEREVFFAPDNSPAIFKGVHRTDYSFNSLGKIKRESHFDSGGSLALNDDGYAIKDSDYDSFGRLRSESYLDSRAMPIVINAGYQRRELVHDKYGNLVGESFWGLQDMPVPVDGRHRWLSVFDERGNKTREESFDALGQRIKNSDCSYLWTADYDERSRMVKKSYFGSKEEPILTSDGMHFWTARYNEMGDQIEGRAYGIRNERIVAWTGYHRWEGDYDANGKQISGRLFDIDGTPIPFFKGGYYKWEHKFDSFGRLLESRGLDADGSPMIDANGDFCEKLTWDKRGRKIMEEHFGLEMEPLLNRDGVFRVTFEYDDQDRQIAMSGYGTQGERVNAWSGFHRMERYWDENGTLSGAMYFGVNGEPVANTDGFHRIVFENDNRGSAIAASYYGSNGQPVFAQQGYHRWEKRFNDLRQQSEGIAFGFGHHPVIAWEGYHRWTNEFDEHGNTIAARCFDSAGKPTLRSPGAFLDTATWDERGNQTSASYFGINEEPVVGAEGWHKWVAEYDVRNNQTSISYFGLSGQKISTNTGFHKIVREFDRFGRKITERAYRQDNQPCLAWSGYHLQRFRYDLFGNQISISYFDENERPVLSTQGIHATEYQYNANRDVIQSSFFDTNLKPVNGSGGYHAVRQVVNERGTIVEISYWNVAMERTQGPDGYWKKTEVVDRRQLPIETRYWDVSDNPCNGPDGVHFLTRQYDDRGDLVSAKAFDEDGSPSEFPEGFHSEVKTYDNRRQILTQAYFDTNGAPVTRGNESGGFHRSYAIRDSNGNTVFRAYFGVDGRKSQPEGRHYEQAEYSSVGKQIYLRSYGEDGSPIDFADGYQCQTLNTESGEYEFRSVSNSPLVCSAVVEKIPENSILARIGIRQNDKILMIGNRSIHNTPELEEVLKEAIRGDFGSKPTFRVSREGEEVTLQIFPHLVVGITRTKCQISDKSK